MKALSGDVLVHFDCAGSQSAPEVVELHIGMVSQQGHGNRGIRDPFRDHQRCQALAEGVVMGSGVPDGHFVGEPRLFWSDRDGHFGDHGDVPAAGSPRVLCKGDGVQFHDTGAEFSIFGR